MDSPLLIRVRFPRGYSGDALKAAEELASHARVHEGLVAGAAGGPWAHVEGRVLVASDEHVEALEWLESNEPLGIIPPPSIRLTTPTLRRYRWRASPRVLADTDFEALAALDGPVVYVWPPAPKRVVQSLRVLAREVTHIGRADSIALVDVDCGDVDLALMYRLVPGRGPGRVMPVPCKGRTQALVQAHRDASRPGAHSAGGSGKQVEDKLVTGANEVATTLRRFALQTSAAWPYEEVWELPVEKDEAKVARLLSWSFHVPAAVGVHRAIVRAIDRRIGGDVPAYVSGRDGDGPLRGPGHLAIQLLGGQQPGSAAVLLGMPTGVADADRQVLLEALSRPLRVSAVRSIRDAVHFTVDRPRIRAAVPFWPGEGIVMRTDVPLVLDSPGNPRNAPWSIEDGVVCSVGYAMRGVLERDGLEWGGGWAFRRELVSTLRERYGVVVVARRVPASGARFVHRVMPGELVVAAHALVNLGRFADAGAGFLALGRARHLGGGLLVPAGDL